MEEFEFRDSVDEKVLRVYDYGSFVYGCNTEKSDKDYIYIVESDNPKLYYSIEKEEYSISVYSEQMFIKLIQEHKIHILECIFQYPITDKYTKLFKLDKNLLRIAISSVASNSFCKAKKKMKQGDTYIGKKSLFHSLRIADFGIQIATLGCISDYTSMNDTHKAIMSNPSTDWEDYKTIYQSRFNNLKSIFKVVAPLDSEKEMENEL